MSQTIVGQKPRMSQLGEKPSIFRPKEIYIPTLSKAFNYSSHVHFIQSGQVFIMDSLGLYQYAVLSKGSYFGDISIMLERQNVFTYMYNPLVQESIPLIMYQIKRDKFLDIINYYPYERSLWKKRAQRRLDLFESYKSMTLLKIMKRILKNFRIIN